eukprot:m.212192 g.212192  ORF g.212192 m.212192 type:complete len:131 (+) comp19810_c0_seq1:129-521(+)
MSQTGNIKNQLTNVDLFTFGTSISTFSGMWQSIWTWNLMAFALIHCVGAIVCLINMRNDVQKRHLWLIPVVFTGLGMLIPLTAGVITATLIAGVYSSAGFKMTTTEAFGYGVGHCVLYVFSALSRNLASL